MEKEIQFIWKKNDACLGLALEAAVWLQVSKEHVSVVDCDAAAWLLFVSTSFKHECLFSEFVLLKLSLNKWKNTYS